MHTYIHPQDGDVTPYQQKLKDLTLDTVWSKLKSSTGLEQKKKDVEVWMDGWIGGWMDSCRDTVWSKLKSSTNLEQKKRDVEVWMDGWTYIHTYIHSSIHPSIHRNSMPTTDGGNEGSP